jgi:hypothetical protein
LGDSVHPSAKPALSVAWGIGEFTCASERPHTPGVLFSSLRDREIALLDGISVLLICAKTSMNCCGKNAKGLFYFKKWLTQRFAKQSFLKNKIRRWWRKKRSHQTEQP